MRLENISEKEKRDLIVSALNKNIFVEAGAGAGKTTIMVSRIINQLMSGVRPEEIVAITFTNAATRSMKDRLLKKATEALQNKEGKYSSEQLTNLQNAMETLDNMQISTIHSFCHRILAESMFEADLPYGFTLADEDQVAQLRDKQFGLWAESLTKQDWEKLLAASKYKSYALASVKSLAIQMSSIPSDYSIEFAKEPISAEEAMDELSQIISEVCDELLSLVNTAFGQHYSDVSEIPDENLIKHGIELRELPQNQDVTDVMKILLATPGTQSFAIKGVNVKKMEEMGIKDKEQQAKFKESVAEDDLGLREFVLSKNAKIREIKAGYDREIYGSYVDYAQSVRKYWDEHRGSDFLTNDLMIEKTKKLIEESGDVRAFFGNKFRYIYVDEFQDTDHLQESFIRLLASENDAQDKLRDGALFVVGDPKQSIYRFRGAEPEVYFEEKDRMEEMDNAYVVELSNNFRSSDRIVDWVNLQFKDKEITPGHPYVPMVSIHPLPKVLPSDKIIAGVYKYLSPCEVSSGMDGYLDRENLSQLILNLVNRGYQIADYDRENQLYYRDIKFSDFLILCMSTPEMDLYLDAFHSYRIPVVIDSKRDISADRDINAFIRLYAFLAMPYDKAAFTGALEVIVDNTEGRSEEGEKILKELRNFTKDMSPFGCLKYLSERPWLFVSRDRDLKAHETEYFQQKIIQMTEKIMSVSCGDRQAVLRAMKDYAASLVEHELQTEPDQNAVRFMNLHKAKGLEGNIVIWTNRRDKAFASESYRQGKKYYPSINSGAGKFSKTVWTAYNGDDELTKTVNEESEAENKRLEYVAATRAGQAMIFMDRLKADKGNKFSENYDLDSLPSVSSIVEEHINELAKTNAAEFPLPQADDYEKRRVKTGVLNQAVFSSESPSDYERESEGKQAAVDAGKAKENTLRRPSGAVFGNVMHRCFELVIRRWNFDPKTTGIEPADALKACARQAINENIGDIPEAQLSDYENFLQEITICFGRWFRDAEIKKKAKRFYTELPFSYMKKEEGKASPIWMHGEADLVMQMEDGSFYLLDYKSDNDRLYPDEASFENRLRGKYGPQIAAYKEAISRTLGADSSKISAALISFSDKDTAPGQKLRLRITEINS